MENPAACEAASSVYSGQPQPMESPFSRASGGPREQAPSRPGSRGAPEQAAEGGTAVAGPAPTLLAPSMAPPGYFQSCLFCPA